MSHVDWPAAPAATLAFDRLAPTYDSVAGGEVFRLLRQRTHDALAKRFPPGCRVLEIGCGTGWDTIFLAARGVRVVACDPADGMVSRTNRRLERNGLEGVASVVACGVQELGSYLDVLDDRRGFDGIVSNFGALNCVARLDALGALARDHLRPGGELILGLMSRTCAIEALYFLATGRPWLSRRRLVDGAVPVSVAGIEVPTFYHRTVDVRAALGPDLTLTTVIGIGVLVPPPYLETRWRRLPEVARRLSIAADRALSPWAPFNRLGDHTLLHFTKRRAAHA